MVYIFEVLSPDVSDFKRIVQIDSNHTFEDFHLLIQASCKFDSSQLASFYLINGTRRHSVEIGFMCALGDDPKIPGMKKTRIGDFVSDEGQKLMYMYDFFNDNYLHIELKGKIMKAELNEPFVAYERGKTPSQFSIVDFDSGEVDVAEPDEMNASFGELEDYYEIYGEMDADKWGL